MQQIKKIGGYLNVDTEGFIVKEASAEKFQEKWKPVIDEVKKAYIEHFGNKLHSIYVRGSVAKGEAVDGISDIDTIALVNLPKDQIHTKWADDFSSKIVLRYPFVEKVEILAGSLEQVDRKNAIHIMLKTQAVCIYGEDISDSLPKLKPGKKSAQHYTSIQSELRDTLDFYKNERAYTTEEGIQKCSWVMKRILRTGFELVMEREQKYTRDLYPCYESFSRYYPEKESVMRRTLELALNPDDNSEVVTPILEEWLLWIPNEVEKIFGFK